MSSRTSRVGDRNPGRAALRAAVVVAGLCTFFFGAGAAGAATRGTNPTRAPATAASLVAQKRPALTLAGQTPVVTGGGPFTVRVRTGQGLPDANHLVLTVTIYECLVNRSDFTQAVTSTTPPTIRLGSSGPLSLTSLATGAPSATGSEYSASVGIEAGGAAAAGSPGAAPVQLVSCSQGTYVGVYPVTVSLGDTATHRVLGQFTTFFSYSNGAASPRLRVGLVLPVGAPVQASSSSRAGAATPLSTGQVTRLAQLMAAVGHAQVPVTLSIVPQTVQDLLVSGRAGRAVVLALDALAADHNVQVVASPYVPIGADTLAASGLTQEVVQQQKRGNQILAALNPTPGIWVADRQLGDGTAAAADALGAHQLVLPATSLASAGASLSVANTFTLAMGHGRQIQAAASDTELARQFASNPKDPVLSAYQMIADLDLTYEELPSDPRGVAVVPPAGWQADPELVSVLLAGLAPSANNPDLAPVTLTEFFSQVPTPTYPQKQGPATRQLAGSGFGSLPASFADSVRKARGKWASFSAAVQGGQGVIQQLNDALLAAESSDLSLRERNAGLHGFTAALNRQLSHIQLATDRTITLTSRTAALPVTILSSAPYHVVGVLSLSSDKLEFPGGAVSAGLSRLLRPVVIDRNTTPVRIQVVARTSGDLPVNVDLASPRGGLVLVHGRLTVRSTATSVVGIVLTLVALAVLLGWWARSSMKRRRARAVQRPTP